MTAAAPPKEAQALRETFEEAAPRLFPAPAWALEAVAEVAAEIGGKPLPIFWMDAEQDWGFWDGTGNLVEFGHATRFHSTGTYAYSHVTILAGTSRTSQESALWHELAHWRDDLTYWRPASRNRSGHGATFQAWNCRLQGENGVPPGYYVPCEYEYKPVFIDSYFAASLRDAAVFPVPPRLKFLAASPRKAASEGAEDEARMARLDEADAFFAQELCSRKAAEVKAFLGGLAAALGPDAQRALAALAGKKPSGGDRLEALKGHLWNLGGDMSDMDSPPRHLAPGERYQRAYPMGGERERAYSKALGAWSHHAFVRRGGLPKAYDAWDGKLSLARMAWWALAFAPGALPGESAAFLDDWPSKLQVKAVSVSRKRRPDYSGAEKELVNRGSTLAADASLAGVFPGAKARDYWLEINALAARLSSQERRAEELGAAEYLSSGF